MSQDVLDFITAVKALADSPLPKFFALVAVSMAVGYVIVLVDAARRTSSRRR